MPADVAVMRLWFLTNLANYIHIVTLQSVYFLLKSAMLTSGNCFWD